MGKRLFHKEMEDIVSGFAPKGDRPSILLHACCGPCAAHVLEKLAPYFKITIWYDNSNIHPREEYELRRTALKSVIEKSASVADISYLEGTYDPAVFFDAVQGLEKLGEGSARCEACMKMRLAHTARRAAELGMAWFTSTLSISPHKDAQCINQLGDTLGRIHGVRFLPNDFKKGGGFQRSMTLCKDWGIYRQNYCGCTYSLQERNTTQKNE